MKYPRANNYLVYKKIDNDRCRISDYSGAEVSVMEVDMETARFLRRLDGKTSPGKCLPGASKAEIREKLRVLKRNGLLRTKKTVTFKGLVSMEVTLWIPGARFQRSVFPKIWNWILLFSWLPLLCMGIFLFMKGMDGYLEKVVNAELQVVAGIAVGLLAGMLFHELSHGAASMSYGVKVFEFGIFFNLFMPGAYAALYEQMSKNRWHRIQILGAGIESNFWLAGFCLMIGKLFPAAGLFFMMGAMVNVLLGLSNLCLWTLSGGTALDGMLIFSEILGVQEIFKEAWETVFSSRKRRKIRTSMGMSGYALIFVYRAVVAFQILFPVSMIANIMVFAV